MKPMLAATAKSLKDIEFPCYCTPKIDGIRCLIVDGKAVSRTLKPIRNTFIQEELAGLPDGLDGELILNTEEGFSKVSSGVMREAGKPDFSYCVFDDFEAEGNYLERIDIVGQLSDGCFPMKAGKRILVLHPKIIHNEEELLEHEEWCLSNGFEGVMIRNDGPYKFGRSTVNEGYLLKWKRFVDGEAEILGFIEQNENANEKTVNELGRGQRSTHKENLIPKGTLGALRVRDLVTGVEFKVGTGFDDVLRQEIWNNQGAYAKKIVKYKSQPHGAKDAPRFPVFLGFRDKDDM
jgi:DNA ligase-1